MSVEPLLELGRRGRLYPGVILHGSSEAGRRAAASTLARTLLCAEAAERRPCGACRHCRRIRAPEEGRDVFHPDFFWIERDLKTATSVETVKGALKNAQMRPFEARGQVFVVAAAETLGGAAADSLLKNLEEPAESSPRHFLLLAPSAADLLPTLRSRSLAVYLGLAAELDRDGDEMSALRERLAAALERFRQGRAAVYLLAFARTLLESARWDDPRDSTPWIRAAAACCDLARESPDREQAARLLRLGQELLEESEARLRGVPAQRILEGVVARCLLGERGPTVTAATG
ncbi:MAG TPA: hypothetical protein VMV46_23045 [Thermoanaerobaculia bacterium]|nr:hypothetical protein [Thermoanaerobaculia bacterium]